MTACLQLDRNSFEDRQDAYEAAVLSTPGISRYCSSADWLLAAVDHLQPTPQRQLFAFADDNGNWLLLAKGPFYELPDLWQPWEKSWMFGCPFVGPDPVGAIRLLRHMQSDTPGGVPMHDAHIGPSQERNTSETGSRDCAPDDGVQGNFELPAYPTGILFGGIPYGLGLHLGLKAYFRARGGLRTLQGADCCQACLGAGLNNYLNRRSAKFRASIRNTTTHCLREGIREQFVSASADPDALYGRLLAIEQKSWKWDAAESIFQQENCAAFYRDLIRRASARGRFRILFLQQDNRDVAYVCGAHWSGVYRGFQMGYDKALARLGIGNYAQVKLMEHLAAEGCEIYDFGMDIDYKRRWTDSILSLCNLLFIGRW